MLRCGPEPIPPFLPPVDVASQVAPPLLLRVSEVGNQLGLSRASVQRLLTTGALPSVQIGRSRRVRYADLVIYVASLAAAGAGLVTTPWASR